MTTTSKTRRPPAPKTNGATQLSNGDLLPFMSDFRALSMAMLAVGEEAPERMTVSQMVFFILAGAANLAGRNPTFSDIKEDVGEKLNRSLHTTYRILMEPSRAFPKGLGWLTSATNPHDNREKIIMLTDKGRGVMKLVGKAMEGR